MHSLVFRESERGRLLPLLHPVILKAVTMQPDSKWFEKNAIFGLLPLFGLLKLGFPSFSSAMEGGEYFLKVPLACPQPCPALAKPVVFVICYVIFVSFLVQGLVSGIQGALCWVKLGCAGTGLKHLLLYLHTFLPLWLSQKSLYRKGGY